jgi:hypothetical protein
MWPLMTFKIKLQKMQNFRLEKEFFVRCRRTYVIKKVIQSYADHNLRSLYMYIASKKCVREKARKCALNWIQIFCMKRYNKVTAIVHSNIPMVKDKLLDIYVDSWLDIYR